MADVFRYEGEERFREAERRVLDEVIAGASFRRGPTGGGLPTWRDNMPCMNAVRVYGLPAAARRSRR